MAFLVHHGIRGQKWGVRRFQNEDGSYKPGAEGRYDPESDGSRSEVSSKATTNKKIDWEVVRQKGVSISNKAHQIRMERLDRSIQRGKDLSQRGYTAKSAVGRALATDAISSAVGYTALNKIHSPVLRSVYRAGSMAVSTINWGIAVRDIADMHAYKRYKKNISKK